MAERVVRVIGQLEPWRHPGHRRELVGGDVAQQRVDRTDVPRPLRRIVPVPVDRGVGGPDVAALSLRGGVVRPRDVRSVEHVTLGPEVEARRYEPDVTLGVVLLDLLLGRRVASEGVRHRPGRTTRVIAGFGGLRRDRVEVVRERGAPRRREEAVEEDVPFGPTPVVRQLAPVELRVRPLPGRRLIESIHLPVVPRLDRARVAVGDVAGQTSGRSTDERPPRAHIHPERDAVRPGKRPEQVVEGSVLFDDEHDVLDRCECRECVRVHEAWRERRNGRGSRDVRPIWWCVRDPGGACRHHGKSEASRDMDGWPTHQPCELLTRTLETVTVGLKQATTGSDRRSIEIVAVETYGSIDCSTLHS